MILGKYEEIRWSKAIDEIAWIIIKDKILIILMSIIYYGLETFIIYLLIGIRSRIESFIYRNVITTIIILTSTQYYWTSYILIIEVLRWSIIILPNIIRILSHKITFTRNLVIETFSIRLLNIILTSNNLDMLTILQIVNIFDGLLNNEINEIMPNDLYNDINTYINKLEESTVSILNNEIHIELDKNTIIVWFIGVKYIKKI